MPYIKQLQRDAIDENLVRPFSCGELNYKLYKVILQYLEDKGESYQTYNDIIGVLSCIDNEIKRKHLTFYEVIKQFENGDVIL